VSDSNVIKLAQPRAFTDSLPKQRARVEIGPTGNLDRIIGGGLDRLAKFLTVIDRIRPRKSGSHQDSPLEESGFEPSVPRDTTEVSRAAHVAGRRDVGSRVRRRSLVFEAGSRTSGKYGRSQ
jgi:hypothetical protein